MSERKDLARAIHKAGTADPDALAAYLIREGWSRQRPRLDGFGDNRVVLRREVGGPWESWNPLESSPS